MAYNDTSFLQPTGTFFPLRNIPVATPYGASAMQLYTVKEGDGTLSLRVQVEGDPQVYTLAMNPVKAAPSGAPTGGAPTGGAPTGGAPTRDAKKS